MRRFGFGFGFAIIALAAVAAAIMQPAAASAQTSADMRAALITTRDLPRGFEVAMDERLLPDVPSHARIFKRERPVLEVVSVGIAEDRVGTTQKNALDFVEELSGSRRADRLADPRIGRDSVRYSFAFSKDGTRFYGDVVSWRHANVIVVAASVSEDPDACICDIARAQQQRLAMAFPISGGSSVRR
jgi:hypothetical protein